MKDWNYLFAQRVSKNKLEGVSVFTHTGIKFKSLLCGGWKKETGLTRRNLEDEENYWYAAIKWNLIDKTDLTQFHSISMHVDINAKWYNFIVVLTFRFSDKQNVDIQSCSIYMNSYYSILWFKNYPKILHHKSITCCSV